MDMISGFILMKNLFAMVPVSLHLTWDCLQQSGLGLKAFDL